MSNSDQDRKLFVNMVCERDDSVKVYTVTVPQSMSALPVFGERHCNHYLTHPKVITMEEKE